MIVTAASSVGLKSPLETAGRCRPDRCSHRAPVWAGASRLRATTTPPSNHLRVTWPSPQAGEAGHAQPSSQRDRASTACPKTDVSAHPSRRPEIGAASASARPAGDSDGVHASSVNAFPYCGPSHPGEHHSELITCRTTQAMMSRQPSWPHPGTWVGRRMLQGTSSRGLPIRGGYRRSRPPSSGTSPWPERMSNTATSSRTQTRPSLP